LGVALSEARLADIQQGKRIVITVLSSAQSSLGSYAAG